MVRLMSQIAVPLLIGLILLLFLKRKNVWRFIQTSLSPIHKGYHSIVHSIQQCSKSSKLVLGVLLILIAARSIYYALHFYPQYDECWNYNYFLSNQIFTSFFAYNNYPLHNVVSFIFLKILPDNTFVLRLPSIIFGLANCLLIFHLIKRVMNKEMLALVAVALFAVLPTTVFYMMFARGVMISVFFLLLLLHFFLLKKIELWTKSEIFILIIIGALAVYSMISAIFFLLILFIFYGFYSILNKEYTFIRNLFLTGLGIIVVCLILFIPMIMGSGLNLGMNSAYGFQTLDWNTLIAKAEFVSRNQIGFYWGSYIFIILNLVLFFISTRKKIIFLNLLLISIPFFFPIVFRMYLPARAIGFQVIAYLFSLIIFLEIILNKVHQYALLVAIATLVVGFSYVSATHTFFTWSAKPDKAAKEIAQIFQSENISQYYDLSKRFQYFVPGILFHHKINNANIDFKTADTNSQRFLPLENFKGDCFVVNQKDFEPTANKKILYEYLDVDPKNTDENKNFILFRLLPTRQGPVRETQPLQ